MPYLFLLQDESNGFFQKIWNFIKSIFSSDSSNDLASSKALERKILCQNNAYFDHFSNLAFDYKNHNLNLTLLTQTMMDFYEHSSKVRTKLISHLFNSNKSNVLFQPFFYFKDKIVYRKEKVDMFKYLTKYLVDYSQNNKLTYTCPDNRNFWEEQAKHFQQFKLNLDAFFNTDVPPFSNLSDEEKAFVNEIKPDLQDFENNFKEWKNRSINSVINMFIPNIKRLVDEVKEETLNSDFVKDSRFLNFKGEVDMMDIYNGLVLLDLIPPQIVNTKRIEINLFTAHFPSSESKKYQYKPIHYI